MHVYAGCEQREAMATVGVLQIRPDLMGLALEIMILLGTACDALLGAGKSGGYKE